MTAVAILAAALASGGTYAATRYATPAPSSSPVATTQSNGSTSPQVIQGNASAPDWTATAKAVAPSVVSITVTSGQTGGQGSGVVIDNQGHILTNNHVATGAGANATISVTLNDGRTYDAKIVGTDPSTDLAVLLLNNPPSDLVPMSIGDSSQVVVGEPVMAIGNPLGLSGTVTTGIVSALDRPVTTQAAESQEARPGSAGPAASRHPAAADRFGRRSSPTRSRPPRRSTPATPAARSSRPTASSSASTARSPPSARPRAARAATSASASPSR